MILRFAIVLVVELLTLGAVTVWAVLDPRPLAWTSLTIVALLASPVLAATAFHLLWRPMLAPFPACEPAPDAVRRRYQSFGLGPVNMGLCVHAAVDDEHLHLVPLAILQSLGARSASIPWSALEPIGTSGRIARLAGKHRLEGPRWCMELVAAASQR